MTKSKKDLYSKTLLMLGLAAALIGVAHAGYDANDLPAHDSQSMRNAHMNESQAMRAADEKMLLQTLSEEFTEIDALASQQVKFREMKTPEATKKWIESDIINPQIVSALG